MGVWYDEIFGIDNFIFIKQYVYVDRSAFPFSPADPSKVLFNLLGIIQKFLWG